MSGKVVLDKTVATLITKKLGTGEARAYKKHVKDCSCDCDVRIETTKYLTSKMFIKRTTCNKPVYQELDKLNHVLDVEKWLNNIDKSILPLLK